MAKIDNAFTKAGTLSGLAEGVAEQILDSAVGGLSPLNNFGRYMNGARAIIKVNDKLFGFAFGVNFSITTDATEVWTIDDWTPYELAPNRITVNGTMGLFHIPGKGPSKELVQANVLSFLFHKYITIEITDQMTGQTIFKTNRAVVTNRSQTLQAGELSTIQLTWKAIGWADEINPQYPQGSGSDSAPPESPISSAMGSASKLFG